MNAQDYFQNIVLQRTTSIQCRKLNIIKRFFCETIWLYVYLQLYSSVKIMKETRRDIFQAIADPTRRAIIALIALQTMTPNAIAAHFDTSRQAVSKHLKILMECEVIESETKGREIYYQLKVNQMKEVDNWLIQFRKIWEDRFDNLDDILSKAP